MRSRTGRWSGTTSSNPRETNGVPTFRARASESIMSVADQYLLRIGVSAPVARRFSASVAVLTGYSYTW
jgi:hypothetical protein